MLVYQRFVVVVASKSNRMVFQEFFNKHLSSDALNVWNDAATAFNDSRATLVPISLSWTPYSLDCYHVLSTADIASNMAR